MLTTSNPWDALILETMRRIEHLQTYPLFWTRDLNRSVQRLLTRSISHWHTAHDTSTLSAINDLDPTSIFTVCLLGSCCKRENKNEIRSIFQKSAAHWSPEMMMQLWRWHHGPFIQKGWTNPAHMAKMSRAMGVPMYTDDLRKPSPLQINKEMSSTMHQMLSMALDLGIAPRSSMFSPPSLEHLPVLLYG